MGGEFIPTLEEGDIATHIITPPGTSLAQEIETTTRAEVFGKTVLQLSHNQIAEEMGTSRVVISRLLKRLENDQKILLYRNEIKLLKAF